MSRKIHPRTNPIHADPQNLIGRAMPDLSFESTSHSEVQFLRELDAQKYVMFIYPRTGHPDRPDSEQWATIPGARGCTAEACDFRDLQNDFAQVGYDIFGLSSQDSRYQSEAAERLHLPYPLLSDPALTLAAALDLETFAFEGATMYKRLTIIVENGTIVLVIVPPSDPASHPDDVLKALRSRVAHSA